MANNSRINPLLGDGATTPFSRTPIEESLTSKPDVVDAVSEEVKTGFSFMGSVHPGKRTQKERCHRQGPRGKKR